MQGFDGSRVCLFVATLGYSRRVYAQAFPQERQSAWLEGIVNRHGIGALT